ncbi:TonB-dependent receptor [Stenotrophomonas maltophilia]|uniref:TonB-dependent siderophore receptor n=1 Tax=Stenotrophomonas TaxID=40323 RepID=UPI0021C68D48|nr:TonB-dependent receptor [Stenotrophomonas maltophilia]MCU1037373.1 TonB-dependent receptor [Stenotrophomonas maltophilia]
MLLHPLCRPALLAVSLSLACAAHAQSVPERTHRNRSATDLDAVKVTAERTHADTGALGDRVLRDTPFAITAVGREQIEQRQVVSLGEAFLLDPSVTTQVSAYASGWSSPIRNRGIDLNFDSYRVNGLQVSSWGTEWPLEVMEQVDLLKGPGGFLYGFGAPGGIVNYITKKPTDTPTFSAQLGWREQGIVSGGMDVGGRFGNEQMFGYRFNAFGEKGETFNGGHVDRKVGALSLDARLSDALIWTFDGVFQSRDLREESPQYYFRGLTSLPRPIAGNSGNSVPGTYYDTRSSLLSTRLDWQINSDWKTSLSYGVTTSWNDVNKIFAYIDSPNGDYDVNVYELGGKSEWKLAQAMLQGSFHTGPLQHQVVAGISHQTGLGWDRPYEWSLIGRANLYQRHAIRHDAVGSRVMTRGDETVQQAVFASDTVDLGSGWSVLAGWRYNDYETKGRYHTYPVTPTYAVMFKPSEAVTLYASYIESLEAGSRVGNNYINAGDVLDPTLSKQYEIGAKAEAARWNANVAAFRLERGANIDELTPAGKRLVQDGITLYEGIEASADLHLSDVLTVGGGVTWLDPTYDRLSPASAAQEGNRTAGAARWSGAVHATYQLRVDGLETYAAVRYYGDVWYDADNTLKLPDYTLVNAGIGYRLLASGHPLTVRASVENLANRKYWSNAGTGLPRTFAVSVRFDM